jgi:hypothetical protein
MNKVTISLVCGVGLVAAAALRADPNPPVTTGRVLVFDNERAVEGDIRCEGSSYCLRRSVGEVWLPGDKVLKLCANWDEAFAFVRSQANPRDPDERLRLARWCLNYGLREQALAEATAAVQMRPNHEASRQLLTLLQRSASSAPAAVPPPPRPVETTAVSPAPAIEVSADSLSLFTARVQPVLMNTCASCHASGKETAFRLSRVGTSSATSRRTTQQNLSAALALLDPDHPLASPLLMRAVTDHGKSGQAPLKAQSPPYQILQEWIQVTLASNPFLREQHRAAEAAPRLAQRPAEAPPSESRPAPPSVGPTAPAPVVSQPLAAAPLPAAAVPVGAVPVVSTSGPGAAPPVSAAAAPADEFDPAPFNQQRQPQP